MLTPACERTFQQNITFASIVVLLRQACTIRHRISNAWYAVQLITLNLIVLVELVRLEMVIRNIGASV